MLPIYPQPGFKPSPRDLPPEIVQRIIGHLSEDQESCDNLALVNSACRHHVRTVRPLEIMLGDMMQHMEIVFSLAAEVVATLGGDKELKIQTVPYVRQLQILFLIPYWRQYVSERTRIAVRNAKLRLSNVLDNQPSVAPMNQVTLEACKALLGIRLDFNGNCHRWDGIRSQNDRKAYNTVILAAMKLVMPNLERLDWYHECLDDSLWPDLNDCIHRVRHLKLEIPGRDWIHIQVDVAKLNLQWLELKSEMEDKMLSDLTTLEANALQREFLEKPAAMLRACAQHLRGVSLDMRNRNSLPATLDTAVHHTIFPSLQNLELRSIDIPDDMTLSLLSFTIRHLYVRVHPKLLAHHQLNRLDQFPALETIKIHDFAFAAVATEHDAATFLHGCTKLKSIHFERETPHDIGQTIAPVLGEGGFTVLTNLSLTWNTDDAEELEDMEDSLEEIGKITSLEKLTLRVETEKYAGWSVRHDVVRDCLCQLQRLRVFAIGGDSYEAFHFDYTYHNKSGAKLSLKVVDGAMYGKLHEMRLLRARPDLDGDYLARDENADEDEVGELYGDDDNDDEWRRVGPVRDRYCTVERRKWFDLVFRNLLLSEAERYAAVLAKLERIHIGALPIMILQPGSVSDGNVMPMPGRHFKFPCEVLSSNDPEENAWIDPRIYE